MRRAVNVIFLVAVLAINFTLLRPSPVDILFVLALVLSVLSGQIVTRNVFIVLCLLLAWLGSLFASSIGLAGDPEVAFGLLKISYAVSIGVCASLVAVHWGAPELARFVKVYILAAFVAATLGIVGVALGIEDLLWDGRAKGYLDDPNMYAGFLLPALFGCMYMLSQRGRVVVYMPALIWILVGLLASFSRAAIVSFAIWGGLYYLVLNRRNLLKAGFYAVAVVAVVALAAGLLAVSVEGLDAKIVDRLTIAKEYDLGHGGRYNRYALAWPIILDNPLGIGMFQLDRIPIFEEPIHNFLISSFLNYGWLAGFAFILLIVFSVAVSLSNYRRTRNQLCIALFLSWLAILSCAFLHEAERWRFMWLFTGLIWGISVRNLLVRPDEERTAGAPSPARARPVGAVPGRFAPA